MRPDRLITKALQPFWRMTRGLTLGAQGVILNHENQVLLIRHGYQPGWHFPGGGVEWNETIVTALKRELHEEAGVELTGPPVLHGIFANFSNFPGDHISLFIVRDWLQHKIPERNYEIMEQGFFGINDLPDGTVSPVRRRLAEIVDQTPLQEVW